jgi:hypothetical protein
LPVGSMARRSPTARSTDPHGSPLSRQERARTQDERQWLATEPVRNSCC